MLAPLASLALLTPFQPSHTLTLAQGGGGGFGGTPNCAMGALPPGWYWTPLMPVCQEPTKLIWGCVADCREPYRDALMAAVGTYCTGVAASTAKKDQDVAACGSDQQCVLDALTEHLTRMANLAMDWTSARNEAGQTFQDCVQGCCR